MAATTLTSQAAVLTSVVEFLWLRDVVHVTRTCRGMVADQCLRGLRSRVWAETCQVVVLCEQGLYGLVRGWWLDLGRPVAEIQSVCGKATIVGRQRTARFNSSSWKWIVVANPRSFEGAFCCDWRRGTLVLCDRDAYLLSDAGWAPQSRSPRSSSNAACCLLDDAVFVCVGSLMLRFDGAWTRRTGPPAPCYDAKAVAHNNRVFILSSRPSLHADRTSTVYVYDPHEDQWYSGPRLPFRRNVAPAAKRGTLFAFDAAPATCGRLDEVDDDSFVGPALRLDERAFKWTTLHDVFRPSKLRLSDNLLAALGPRRPEPEPTVADMSYLAKNTEVLVRPDAGPRPPLVAALVS